MGRHPTFLSREEHGVAAGALFYKVEGEKHCVMRKSILCLFNYMVPSNYPRTASQALRPVSVRRELSSSKNILKVKLDSQPYVSNKVTFHV